MSDHNHFFHHIKYCYDIAVLRTIRNLENNIKKICRSKEHLTFLHRCKDKGLIPKSLKVKAMVKTREGYAVAKHCEYRFLQAAISELHEKIPYLDYLIHKSREELTNILESNILYILENHLQIIQDITTSRTRDGLVKKLNRLIANKKDKHVLNKHTWVINLSARVLNESEINLLSKGLNFATTEKYINFHNFLAPIEAAITNLPPERAERVRQETSQVLRYWKKPEENTSSEEKEILKSLKVDKTIIILPADKGKATVILNHQEYDRKIMDLLNDESVYEKLSYDPTLSTQTRMNNILLSLKKAEKLDEKTYFHLHCSSGVIPRFYGLPNVHKINTPLRPIVAYYTSPLYNLAKYLNNILSPYGVNQFSIKTSAEFVKKIRDKRIEKDEVMVSFDVVSLFTCIPTKLACLEIETMLKNDSQLQNRTKLNTEDIIRLLNLCLNSASIIYNKQIYNQKFGTAMGSPISPLVANCVMSRIEMEALDSFTPRPTFWCRYIDDTFCIIHKDHADRFLNHLNDMNPHLKFTMEKEESQNLHFLDVLVSRKNKRFLTTVFRKETNTDQYINYKSNHPDTHKASAIRTLFKRSLEINNSRKHRLQEDKKLKDIFINNDYPLSFINKYRYPRINNIQKNNKPKNYICIPFVDGTSQKIRRILRKHDIGTNFKPGNTLKNILCHPKNVIEEMDRSNTVYAIPCKHCPKKYIGQTSKQLKDRLSEHKKNVMKGETRLSAVANHSHSHNHLIDWENAKALHQNNSLKQRLFLESWEFNQNNTFEKNKTQKLADTYKSLLYKQQ